MKNFITVFVLIVFALNFKVYAHDVWLSPDSYDLKEGDNLIIHHYSGHELEDLSELPLIRSVTSNFKIYTKNSEIDLIEELKSKGVVSEIKPVLSRKMDLEGQVLVSMVHEFYYTDIDNKDFSTYLDFEELNEKYKKIMEKKQTQRERFARSMKSLVQVGKDREWKAYKKNLGHKIEIVLLDDPNKLEDGKKIKAKVLFEGKPLDNKLVFALNKNKDTELIQLKSRTNEKGEVEFELKREGEWLIRLVLLRHCSEVENLDCSNADWESHWAAYTFRTGK